MTQEQWDIGYIKSIAVFLNGNQIPSPGKQGERISDNDFLMFFNAHYEAIDFKLAELFQPYHWSGVIDTKEPRFITEERLVTGDQIIPVAARSLMVLQRLI